jgi:hypothetical protein
MAAEERAVLLVLIDGPPVGSDVLVLGGRGFA